MSKENAEKQWIERVHNNLDEYNFQYEALLGNCEWQNVERRVEYAYEISRLLGYKESDITELRNEDRDNIHECL